MRRRKQQCIQIDPVRPARSRTGHPVLVTFYVLIFGCVLYASVWFLAFSEYGLAWSGNTARLVTETPESVVTSYPHVEITLDDVALLLDINESRTIRPHFRKLATDDIRFKDLKVRWRSENPSVATVDSNGRVTGLRSGTARIFVTITNSDIDSNTANCLVTVRKWRVSRDQE